MKKRTVSVKVSAAIGSITAEIFMPTDATALLVLAHGAGAGMYHEFMTTLARSLSDHKIATMRFNFPFMENKKGRPDTPAVAHQAISAAISKAKKLYPALPLFAAGKSFGGRMTSQFLALQPDDAIQGIIFYGFPLHPPGKPSVERAAHLKDVKTKMLFLQGTRDELASWDLIQSVCKSLKMAKLERIEGANHAFKAGKQDIMKVLVDHTVNWVRK